MSRNAWLTPNETTETRLCWRVFVPDNEAMQAAFRGALQTLAEVENWEEYGSATEQEAADMWNAANALTFVMNECESGGGEVPIGTVFWFASEIPPTGALLCDGALLSTTTYAALYAVIGNAFGGDASNFNLPDLQGQFIRGSSDTEAIADSGGAATHQLTVAELPAHQHLYNRGASSGGIPTSSPLQTIRKVGTWLTDSAGSNFPHENLPPYVTLAPMIQAE